MSVRSLLLSWLLKHSVGAIDPLKVFSYEESSGVVKINGEQITSEELRQLKAEVFTLQQFKIWSIMVETVRQKAFEKALISSHSFEEVLVGKAMLLDLDILKKILELVQKAKLL